MINAHYRPAAAAIRTAVPASPPQSELPPSERSPARTRRAWRPRYNRARSAPSARERDQLERGHGHGHPEIRRSPAIAALGMNDQDNADGRADQHHEGQEDVIDGHAQVAGPGCMPTTCGTISL